MRKRESGGRGRGRREGERERGREFACVHACVRVYIYVCMCVYINVCIQKHSIIKSKLIVPPRNFVITQSTATSRTNNKVQT